MKKNSLKYLERLIEKGVEKHLPALKDFRFRENGLKKIVTDAVPREHDALMDIADRAKWLINNVPDDYIYGEMIDIDNAIASNINGYLSKYADTYLRKLR